MNQLSLKEVMIEDEKKGDEKYTCDVWFSDNTECNYVCLKPTNMLNHMRTIHMSKNIRN